MLSPRRSPCSGLRCYFILYYISVYIYIYIYIYSFIVIYDYYYITEALTLQRTVLMHALTGRSSCERAGAKGWQNIYIYIYIYTHMYVRTFYRCP